MGRCWFKRDRSIMEITKLNKLINGKKKSNHEKNYKSKLNIKNEINFDEWWMKWRLYYVRYRQKLSKQWDRQSTTVWESWICNSEMINRKRENDTETDGDDTAKFKITINKLTLPEDQESDWRHSDTQVLRQNYSGSSTQIVVEKLLLQKSRLETFFTIYNI